MDTVTNAWLQYRLDYQAAMHAKDRESAFAKADSNYKIRLQLLESAHANIIEEIKNEPL